ncbi:hypothetical protein BGW38_000910 [Lunasporangiospora selenospora]|uniref:Nucleoporin Nup188 N-terminal subdomain III domain-containing protein n=1 Tax=Lunasporangiospora selenospora TaxID=979761 RepID=A0A9P6G294_9FUNG|nr:hypothetical protein BGW38_000910 [Lunasporangiospora selenospora]
MDNFRSKSKTRIGRSFTSLSRAFDVQDEEARRESEVLKAHIEEKLGDLMLGLDAFKQPAATSRNNMATATTSNGVKYTTAQINLAKRLSDAVKLDELQALLIVEELTAEMGEIPETITDQLVGYAIAAYWDERLSLLRFLGKIVKLDKECEPDSAYSTASVSRIRSQSVATVQKLLSQWIALTLEGAPEYFNAQSSKLDLWIYQSLTEQRALLEAMILIAYAGIDNKATLPSVVLTALLDSKFGSRQQYKARFKLQAVDQWDTVRQLCVLLSVASLDLEIFYMASVDDTYINNHIFQSEAQVIKTNTILETAESQQELGPFIMAWSSILFAGTESSLLPKDMDELGRLYRAKAVEGLHVFTAIHELFSNELFSVDLSNGSIYKRIFFGFMEAVLLFTPANKFKDFDGLATCYADIIVREPHLCEIVWREESLFGHGARQVLEAARSRFPVLFEPFMKLMISLASGGISSAGNAVQYFHHLPTLAHFIPLSSPSVEDNVDAITGNRIIKSVHDVPLGILPSRPFMTIPQGLEGRLVSGENAVQIIRWDYQSSGWKLCSTMINAFLQINPEDHPEDICVEAAHIKAILSFLQPLLQYYEIPPELLSFFSQDLGTPLIPMLFALLDHCAKLQKPHLDVIASTLGCLTSLCSALVPDVWVFLIRSAFIPSVVTTTVQFPGSNRIQTSGLISNILTRSELIQGEYSVTIAFLDLIHVMIVKAQEQELWVQDEIRCLQARILYPCLAYIQNEVFANYHSWHYKNIRDQFSIGSKVLTIFNRALGDLPLLSQSGDASDPVSLTSIQDCLIRDFLYDGGKRLALPLVSAIGTAPDLSTYFCNYQRDLELDGISNVASQGLEFVKTLLRHRKIVGGEPSFLEVYLVERTVGRANASLIHVLASYNDSFCGTIAAQTSTEVLSLLCSLTFEWKSRPSFVGYLGTTEEADRLISTFINKVADDSQPITYRIAIWSLITITLTTQPGLATLFLSNKRVDSATGLLKPEFKEISKNSIVSKALDILHKNESILETEPEILPHALHFLDVLWQNSKDHVFMIKILQNDVAFWKDLQHILSRPEANVDQEWARRDAAPSSYDLDKLSQNEGVATISADQRSRGHALRIFALATYYHNMSKGNTSKDVESLPEGIKEFVQSAIDKDLFLEWNAVIPRIHYQIQTQHLLRDICLQRDKPFDYQKLAVKRWDNIYDTDILPGDSFMLDLLVARYKLFWRTGLKEREIFGTILYVNRDSSIVHSELFRLSAWRFFVEILTSSLGVSIWTGVKRSSASGSDAYYSFVNCLLEHIERETQGSLLLQAARQDCCQILQSVIENVSSVKRADKKNLAARFPEIVSKLQRVIQGSDMNLFESIQRPEDQSSAHRPLLLTVLFCYRALHDKEVLSSIDPASMEGLQKSAILLLPLIASCFAMAVESHLAERQDHSENIVLLLALLEELCHPLWSPHPSLWTPILRNLEVFRLTLQLCARSVSTGDYDHRPSFLEGGLNFLLALANVPEAGAYLCDAGVMSMLTHNGLTQALQRGEISHMDDQHGDRGNWHQTWCMILAVVTGLLRSMASSDAFLQMLIGFIQLYGDQFSKGLDSSTDRPLTSAKLEEMERITMLFYELSKHEARLEALGGGELLKAFIDRSLFILQHTTYLFTHPNMLASLIMPITRAEQKNPEAGGQRSGSGVDSVVAAPSAALSTLIESKLATVARNILATMLVWTDPAVILTRSNIEWPVRKAIISPTSNTPVYEPASIGTLFDLVGYATTSLKEWEARLEGKAGGAAGLNKDTKEEKASSKDANSSGKMVPQRGLGSGIGRANGSSGSGASSSSISRLSSKLECFGRFGDSSSTTMTVASKGTAGSSSAGNTSPPGSSSSSVSSTSKSSSSAASSSTASSSTSMASKANTNEPAFATLSTTTGSSIRMISLLEDALVVIATQLGLYMYHPQLDASVRREIQDLSLDLISTLSSSQRILQRFENVVPTQAQVRKDGLGDEALTQIRGLRDRVIPVLKYFAETKFNLQ